MDSQQDEQTYAIIGAAMEVHRELGRGFLEAVYHEALAFEFDLNNIPYKSEAEIDLIYKGRSLAKKYRADFICNDEIIVEIKAIKQLGDVESSQIINYLKATGLKRGLLLNFGSPSLEHQRFVNNFQPRNSSKSA